LVYTFDNSQFPPGAPAPIPPAYTTGAYTDGPGTTPASSHPASLWLQDLAVQLGLPVPTPSLAPLFGGPPGTDYAVGSAVTGGLYPSMNAQVAQYLSSSPASPSTALYVLWGGSNDLLDVNPALLPGNPLLLQTAATDAISNLAGEIGALAAGGAKYFVWVDLPPLGSTPAITALNQPAYAALLDAASASFRQQWSADIPQLQQANPGITIIGVDVYSLFESLIANPNGLNVTGIPQGDTSANPDTYLFWDGLHPTTVGHALVADEALAAIEATPEPATAALLLLGFLGLARSRFIRPKVAPKG
jgi:phospholipase/lecithinase/hemolysin